MTSESLSDADLVETLLGVSGGGYALLGTCGGIRGLARHDMHALAETIAPDIAKRLAAAIELGRRCVEAAALEPETKLPDGDAVVAWARPRLAGLDHEELWVLCLDGRHGLREAVKIAQGGVHGLHVTARDPVRAALREAASAFVLVHNHPSGDPTPSEEDLSYTTAVLKAAAACGTPLLDHVIVARSRHKSMLDMGLLGTLKHRKETA